MSEPQSKGPGVSSLFRLDGKVAFLSGATGLLGRPMAEALCAAGAHVILNARNQDRVEALASEMTSRGYQVSTASFDVTDRSAVRGHVARIADQHGRLDILINNASSGRSGTSDSATAEDFEQAYRVNVIAAFEMIQASLPILREAARRAKGSASVVNVGSMYGSVSPDPSIYGHSGANNPPYY